jgi:two-component system response regulator
MPNKILLVEDSPDDQMFIVKALKDQGVGNEIKVVSDGQEALDYLFAQGAYAQRDLRDSPTVTLLDLHLPKVEGLEVLQRLRADERTKRLPIVILTSSNGERDRMKGYDLGANSYVKKPVEIEAFTRAVKELKLYWLLINEPPPS